MSPVDFCCELPVLALALIGAVAGPALLVIGFRACDAGEEDPGVDQMAVGLLAGVGGWAILIAWAVLRFVVYR